MTREEAIKHGKEQLEIFDGEHKEFIEVAIKSLNAWDWIITKLKYLSAISRNYRFKEILNDVIGLIEFHLRIVDDEDTQILEMEEKPEIIHETVLGEWVEAREISSCIYKCSECGETWDIFSGVMPLPNYCPNCGARMSRGDS